MFHYRRVALGVLVTLLVATNSNAVMSSPPPPRHQPPPPPSDYSPPPDTYPPPPPPRSYPPRIVRPVPPPLAPAMRVIYAPFYAAGLIVRYGFYYTVVAPFEVFRRARGYGVEGGVDQRDDER